MHFLNESLGRWCYTRLLGQKSSIGCGAAYVCANIVFRFICSSDKLKDGLAVLILSGESEGTVLELLDTALSLVTVS